MPPIYGITRFHPEDKKTGVMILVTHLHLASVSKPACSYTWATHSFRYRVHGNFTPSTSPFYLSKINAHFSIPTLFGVYLRHFQGVSVHFLQHITTTQALIASNITVLAHNLHFIIQDEVSPLVYVKIFKSKND